MADIFSESIEQHLKHKEQEKQVKDRVSMNEVAKQQQEQKRPEMAVYWPETPKGMTAEPLQERTVYAAPGHTLSRVQIYTTKQYDRFVKMAGNRSLNKAKINRIKKDIDNGLDMLRYCPIIVAEKDGKLEVLDGQHRLQVCKDLKSPVWYIMADELTILEIARVNSNTEKWKNKDYIHCYVSQGNENYRKVEAFMGEYGFPLSVALALLTKGVKTNDGGEGSVQKQFQEGGIVVKYEAEARRVADIAKQFEGFSAWNSRTFVVAICKIMEADKMPMQEVVAAYLANKDKLQPQGNWKNYLAALEVIVNIGKSKRRILY